MKRQMRILDEIKHLCSEGRYAEAVQRIKEIERAGDVTAELLVQKAMCLQIVDDDGALDEVEQTFETALKLDPESVHALVEFGWFQLNVKDQPQCAKILFRKAFELQVSVNTEIVAGILKCNQEVSPQHDSDSLLTELMHSLIDESKIEDSVTQ
jgi:Flp pilus assembly protein TadD